MRNIIFIFITFHILSCSLMPPGKEKEFVEKIFIPDDVEFYNPNISNNLSLENVKHGKIQIYSMIDVSCATCLKKLDYWENFANTYRLRSAVSIFALCFSKDRFEGFKYLFESGELKHIRIPILLDSKGTFFEQYHDMYRNGINTFVVDSSGGIIFKGDPIQNKNHEEFILELIK